MPMMRLIKGGVLRDQKTELAAACQEQITQTQIEVRRQVVLRWLGDSLQAYHIA